MVTPRRTRQREATRDEIKQHARRLMAEQGPSALSLHAIARRMGLTHPALYRYFPTRDDLVTALLVEAYQSQGDAMLAASEVRPQADRTGRLLDAILAYRTWALAHPVDYALLAGNPVPGYTRPPDLVSAAARRGMDLLMALVHAALRSGAYAPPPITLSAALAAMLEALREERGYELPLTAIYQVLVGWGQAQGLVTQEVFRQLQPLVADPGELYRCEARAWLQRLGLPVPVLPLEEEVSHVSPR